MDKKPFEVGMLKDGTMWASMQIPEDPQKVVTEQTNDEALWSIYEPGHQPIGEAILQEALRRLHAAVEGKWFDGYKGKYCE